MSNTHGSPSFIDENARLLYLMMIRFALIGLS